MKNETIIIIPTYNNARTLKAVLEEVLSFNIPVIAVNDGSTDGTADILSGFPSIEIITHPVNRGKGMALRSALERAIAEGYRYAISIDSDGQHYPADIPLFLEAAREHPDSLLIGARDLASDNMPGRNTFANRFSNFWIRLETGHKLVDSQCGFRLYPLHKLEGVRFHTSKYEFELEVIVKASWRGVRVKNIPIRVHYPPRGERVSHFRPLRDFARISLLNTVLVLTAFLWYWPMHFLRGMTRENARRFIERYITRSGESNLRITLAVMLGIFMGIAPVWGYQMILAALLAHLLRLNKVIALVASNISIPPMIPFILFGSYATGARMLGRPLTLTLHEATLATVRDSLVQYLAGSVVFAAGCALVAGVACLLLLAVFRRTTPKVA